MPRRDKLSFRFECISCLIPPRGITICRHPIHCYAATRDNMILPESQKGLRQHHPRLGRVALFTNQ